MKRIFDFIVSIIILLIVSPVFLILSILIWRQDHHSPFYIALRVGKKSNLFKMIKLRSMIVGADKTGVDSTSADDNRITKLGKFIRSYKLDELSQLINVLKGDMSLVGPRPNVLRDVALYTEEERKLLTVKPGITDLSSIVFADEGEILAGSKDPDVVYNQLIRPWKSRLGILYVERQSFLLDIKLMILTIITIFSQQLALRGIHKILNNLNASDELKNTCNRKEPLRACPPPGADQIVTSREIMQ